MRDIMVLFGILYFIGAICFWMWEYENGQEGSGPLLRAIAWPFVTVARAARLAKRRFGYWREDREIRKEEEHWAATVGDIEDDPIMQQSLPWDHPDSDPIGDIQRAIVSARDYVAPTTHEHYEVDGMAVGSVERPMTLEELRERALGPTGPLTEIEDEDGGITFSNWIGDDDDSR